MRRIREVLRLKHELRRSHREVAGSLGIANSTVSDYLGRARAAGFSWPLPVCERYRRWRGTDPEPIAACRLNGPVPVFQVVHERIKHMGHAADRGNPEVE